MHLSPDLHDRALGAILGALVGDAAGAVLEFAGLPSTASVQAALTFPGGGWWKVAPGQITDDGELTLSLARALLVGGQFDIEAIARSYARWLASRPFDIGQTTRAAFSAATEPSFAESMAAAAQRHSMLSKANGSLMRATPLGVWGHQLDDSALNEIAWQDSDLSHPNASCCEAVALYTIAIAELVHAGDRARALQRVSYWAEARVPSEVGEWLVDAMAGQIVPFHPQSGFVRIAFTHAFRLLAAGTTFETALFDTLAGGGDTDTNACIVGGLLGAVPDPAAMPLSVALHLSIDRRAVDTDAFCDFRVLQPHGDARLYLVSLLESQLAITLHCGLLLFGD